MPLELKEVCPLIKFHGFRVKRFTDSAAIIINEDANSGSYFKNEGNKAVPVTGQDLGNQAIENGCRHCKFYDATQETGRVLSVTDGKCFPTALNTNSAQIEAKIK